MCALLTPSLSQLPYGSTVALVFCFDVTEMDAFDFIQGVINDSSMMVDYRSWSSFMKYILRYNYYLLE